MLVDQPLYVKKLYKGYAIPTYGPVPAYPTNPYITKEVRDNPLQYNASKAKELLSSHGWKIVPGGTDTCTKPGTSSDQCGAGIPAGTPLETRSPESRKFWPCPASSTCSAAAPPAAQ